MSAVVKFLIRAGTALIPLGNVRRRVRKRLFMRVRDAHVARMRPIVWRRYADIERACRGKLSAGEKVKVAFLVCDASMFTFEGVFQRFVGDDRFDSFIAVVPRVSRGDDFLRATLEKTMSILSGRYGDSVRLFYDVKSRRSVRLDGEADIVFTSIAYEDQTCPEYTVERMSASALTVSALFAYDGLFSVNVRATAFLPNVIFSWRFFLSTPESFREWTTSNPGLLRNVVVGGYVKMDRLAGLAREGGGGGMTGVRRRTVMICPHHSIGVGPGCFHLSTFLMFSDFFLKLPGLYPNVRFVFRPHPLLFPRLRTRRWWGEEKTAAYEKAMEAWPNVEFQRGGDYFRTFVESDALIHDCGSFLAEYLYTGKPQCYLFEDEETMSREFLPFGRKLLEAVSKAFAERDVLDFIDRVVVGGEDGLAPLRRKLAESEVCLHYPNASGHVKGLVVEAIEGHGEAEGGTV